MYLMFILTFPTYTVRAITISGYSMTSSIMAFIMPTSRKLISNLIWALADLVLSYVPRNIAKLKAKND